MVSKELAGVLARNSLLHILPTRVVFSLKIEYAFHLAGTLYHSKFFFKTRNFYEKPMIEPRGV
jgi:hypothetical protein